MSPSSMRKTNWHTDGTIARHDGQPRTANPYSEDPPYYHRGKAWLLGWDDADRDIGQAPEVNAFDAALASLDFATAARLAEDLADLKLVVAAIAEAAEAG